MVASGLPNVRVLPPEEDPERPDTCAVLLLARNLEGGRYDVIAVPEMPPEKIEARHDLMRGREDAKLVETSVEHRLFKLLLHPP